MGFRVYLRSHSAFVCGASVGILLAFPLAAPVFDGKILEPVATLWGNALGAIGAVAAAIWATDRVAHQQRRQGAGMAVAFISPIAESLGKLAEFYGRIAPIKDDELEPPHTLPHNDAKKVSEMCGAIYSDRAKFLAAMPRLEAVLTFLGPDEMQLFFNLEEELENMHGVVNSLHNHAVTFPGDIYPHTPSTHLRTNLLTANRRIQDLTARMKKAAA